jgi:hypothetical protein
MHLVLSLFLSLFFRFDLICRLHQLSQIKQAATDKNEKNKQTLLELVRAKKRCVFNRPRHCKPS